MSDDAFLERPEHFRAGIILPIMVHLGNLTVIDQNEPLLMELDAQDLVYLLELPEVERMGHIISLNRTPRYANSLNAFALLQRLMEASRERPST